MKKEEIIKSVCARHCRYYKPSKDESLSCRGFLVIERLIEKGKEIVVPEKCESAGPHTEEALVGNMCVACPFFPDDCDFSLKKKGSLPCGGFLVLASLLEAGRVRIDDIRDID